MAAASTTIPSGSIVRDKPPESIEPPTKHNSSYKMNKRGNKRVKTVDTPTKPAFKKRRLNPPKYHQSGNPSLHIKWMDGPFKDPIKAILDTVGDARFDRLIGDDEDGTKVILKKLIKWCPR